MNDITPITQTFFPPEGGFTEAQKTEYAALSASNEELAETSKRVLETNPSLTTQERLEKINACDLHSAEQLALIWGERFSDESTQEYLERLVESMESKLKSMTRKAYYIPANHNAAQFLTATLGIVKSHPVYEGNHLGKS